MLVEGEGVVRGLLAVRVFALLLAQSVWRLAVGPSWVVVAAALALYAGALWPGPTSAAASLLVGPMAGVERVVELAICEALLGLGLGILASLPSQALEGSGELTSQSLRLGSSDSLRALLRVVALYLALGLGVHHGLAGTMDTWLAVWPVGEPETWSFEGVTVDAALALGDLCVLGLSLATPVWLTTMLVDVAGSLAARAGLPGTSTLVGRDPHLLQALRLGVGLLALWTSWEAYPQAWARSVSGGP